MERQWVGVIIIFFGKVVILFIKLLFWILGFLRYVLVIAISFVFFNFFLGFLWALVVLWRWVFHGFVVFGLYWRFLALGFLSLVFLGGILMYEFSLLFNYFPVSNFW